MSVTSDTFRQVLGSFASGVTVVTTRADGAIHGTTMSAFCSLSLNPPLVLVCVDKTADSHDLIARAGIFAVNILHEGQRELSQALSRKGTPELEAAHRLEGIPHWNGVTGAPILRDHLAYAECRLVQAVEAGDHTIYVGRVEAVGVADGVFKPLLYYRGRYGSVGE